MSTFINVHTHIFSRQHVPEFVVGQNRWLIPISTSKLGKLGKPVLTLLGPVLKLFGNVRKVNRLITFAELGLATDQETLFEALKEAFEGTHAQFRFVVLPMDMSQMGAGPVSTNLETQLREIHHLRQNPDLAERILPFYPVDPRAYPTAKDLIDRVELYFKRYGFVGIKLYPALGYLPTHPFLLELYKWTIRRKVPIMSHCIEGSIHWQGAMDNWEGMLTGLDEKDWDPKWIKHLEGTNRSIKKLDRGIFQRNFTQPENFERAIQLLQAQGVADADQLKVCFGHFGMDDEIWFPQCQQLIARYENFYADISYSLAQPKNDERLHKIFNEPPNKEFTRKVLFGTDYFVVSKEKTESEILKNYMGKFSFHPYADENNRRYLHSDFYSG